MTTLDEQAVWDVLKTIPDPEMPISIVDLGIVDAVELEGGRVAIDILPTFVGCPALDMIERDVRRAVGAMPGVTEVDVSFRFEPAWSTDRITEAGRKSLAEHGVGVPRAPGPAPVELRISAVPCPFCGSSSTRMESPFGPTRCRMIFYCDACRNGFEQMKRIVPA